MGPRREYLGHLTCRLAHLLLDLRLSQHLLHRHVLHWDRCHVYGAADRPDALVYAYTDINCGPLNIAHVVTISDRHLQRNSNSDCYPVRDTIELDHCNFKPICSCKSECYTLQDFKAISNSDSDKKLDCH